VRAGEDAPQAGAQGGAIGGLQEELDEAIL